MKKMKIVGVFMRKFHLFLMLLLVISPGCIFGLKIINLRFNHDGSKIFVVEEKGKHYELYILDEKLTRKQFIYSGSFEPSNISSNPAKNILLFTYSANGNGKHFICIYDCNEYKYLYKKQHTLGEGWIEWNKRGDKIYFGETVINVNEEFKETINSKTNFTPQIDGLTGSVDNFDWSDEKDICIYTKHNELFLYDTRSRMSRKLKTLDSFDNEYEHYFTGAFLISEDLILYSYQKGPEFPGKIALLDTKTCTVKNIYLAPYDYSSSKDAMVALSIERVIDDECVIFSEYVVISECLPRKFNFYLLNTKNQKVIRLFEVKDETPVWDYNQNTKKLVYLQKNRVKLADVKNP